MLSGNVLWLMINCCSQFSLQLSLMRTVLLLLLISQCTVHHYQPPLWCQ